MPWQTENGGISPAARGAQTTPQPRLRPLGDAERAAHVAQPSGTPRLWPWIAGAAALATGVGAAFLLEHFTRVTTTLAPPGRTLAPAPGAVATFDPLVLAWPGLAVTVILAAYLALRLITADRRDAHRFWHTADHPR